MRRLPGLGLSLVLVGLLGGAVPAAAQDFRRGLSAFNRGEYGETLQQWLPLARLEDADAQAGLGYLYFKGLGVLQDYGEAAVWFSRAAERGQPEAQLLLGLLNYSRRNLDRAARCRSSVLPAGRDCEKFKQNKFLRLRALVTREPGQGAEQVEEVRQCPRVTAPAASNAARAM